jgi:hypothetical protein
LLARHPRWTFHFAPTSCSWLKAVEGFFAKLTRRRLKNGVFHSVVDLQAALNRFISEYNAANPKPFVWKAKFDDIIEARNRGFQTLESIQIDDLTKPLPFVVVEQLGRADIAEEYLDLLVPRHFLQLGDGPPARDASVRNPSPSECPATVSEPRPTRTAYFWINP